MSFELNIKTDPKSLEVPEGLTLEVLREFTDKDVTRYRVRIEGNEKKAQAFVKKLTSVKVAPSGEKKQRKGTVNARFYLACVAEALTLDGGYISKKKAEQASKDKEEVVLPTSQHAWRLLTETDYTKTATWAVSLEVAEGTLKWARTILDPAKSEMDENMAMALAKDDLSEMSIGHAAYAVVAYQQYQEVASDRSSIYVGAPGDVLEDFRARVMMNKAMEGDYGAYWILKFKDAEGNIFVWFAKRAVPVKAKDAVMVRSAQVSERNPHTEYQGVKQTGIKWCNMTKLED